MKNKIQIEFDKEELKRFVEELDRVLWWLGLNGVDTDFKFLSKMFRKLRIWLMAGGG